MHTYKFTITYMKGSLMCTHTEVKDFANLKQASVHFNNLLAEYKVNAWNTIPSYSYCRIDKEE